MDKLPFIPVFVVGAPRSGTHLLATSLLENMDCVYRNEINEFWKSSHPFLKTDMIPESKAGAKTIRKKRRQIARVMADNGNKPIYLEKTVSNALRLPYLRRIFPEAIFIHIIRDGRASAYSIRKQYYGNIKKITQFDTGDKEKDGRLNNMWVEIKRRLTKGFNPILFITGFRRYWKTGLLSLGILKFSTWGPRYPGFEYKSGLLSPIQLAGDQWLTLVSAGKNYFNTHDNDNSLIECRYEELLKNPDEELDRIIRRIHEKNLAGKPKHNIMNDTPVDSFDALSPDEKNELSNIISSMQKYLGYE